MTISSIIRNRGIKEILHFTTNEGLLGILHTKLLKSRERLPEDKQLEYIFKPNAVWRKDTPWLDYINLSITRINAQFFEIVSEKWHKGRDIWWCVLSFDPIILTEDGVYFTTTNNIYTDVKRGRGADGLEALFASRISQWGNKFVIRDPQQPLNYTTCPQAEVLYPGELSTKCLNKIYVLKAEHDDEICGQLSGVCHPTVEVVVTPKVFNGEGV